MKTPKSLLRTIVKQKGIVLRLYLIIFRGSFYSDRDRRYEVVTPLWLVRDR